MSKITRRSYKRKKIIMGIALFGAVGLVSTGFAAWVLSSNVDKNNESQMKVGAVADKSMSITIDKVEGLDTRPGSETLGEMIETGDFSFNPRHNDTTGRVRYGSSGDDCGERLTLRVSGTITEAQNLGSLSVGPKVIPDSITQAETVDKYIVAPDCLKEEVTLVKDTDYVITENEGVTTASFQFNVTFGWGEAFGFENPGDYYDTKTLDEVSTAEINETLTAMHNLLDSVKFQIVITAYVN